MKKLILLISITTLLQSCLVNEIMRSVRWAKMAEPITKEYNDTIPFNMEHGWVVASAKIGKNKGKYILDTGAPTLLDYKLNGRDGVVTKPERDTSYDHIESPFDRLMKCPYDNMISVLSLGSAKFKNVGAGTLKFRLFSNASYCERYNGIIGVNVMNDGVWKVNFETNQIFISNDVSKLEVDKTYGFKMYPFKGMKNPIIKMPIGDTIFNALLDLGNAGYIIVSEDKQVNQFKEKSESIIVTKPAKLMMSPLAPEEHQECLTAILELNSNLFSKTFPFYAFDYVQLSNKEFKQFDIVVGNQFMKNFNITFDWPNEMVYFEPIKEEFEKPLEREFKNFNIGFFNYDKKVYVQSVFPRFCDTTLVSVSDTVKAINGVSIEDIVGDNYCDFISGGKSLIPETDDPIFITVKNKKGVVNQVEMKTIRIFE